MQRLLILAALLVATIAAQTATAGEKQFLDSATVNNDGTVTLPLYEGRSGNRQVWYIVTEASDGDEADEFGVSKVNKLDNVRGTAAVQTVSVDSNGVVNFSRICQLCARSNRRTRSC